nr:MAG: hypothetical protein [Microvirus sp.]
MFEVAVKLSVWSLKDGSVYVLPFKVSYKELLLRISEGLKPVDIHPVDVDYFLKKETSHG